MVSDGLILQFSARVPEHPVNRVPAFVCNSAVRGVKPKHKPALTRRKFYRHAAFAELIFFLRQSLFSLSTARQPEFVRANILGWAYAHA